MNKAHIQTEPWLVPSSVTYVADSKHKKSKDEHQGG